MAKAGGVSRWRRAGAAMQRQSREPARVPRVRAVRDGVGVGLTLIGVCLLGAWSLCQRAADVRAEELREGRRRTTPVVPAQIDGAIHRTPVSPQKGGSAAPRRGALIGACALIFGSAGDLVAAGGLGMASGHFQERPGATRRAALWGLAPPLLAAGLLGGAVALMRRRPLAGEEERDRSLANLRASEEVLRAISAGARDAIVMIDDRGCVTHWSAAAETMFGYTAAEILGRELHPLIVPEDQLPAYRRGIAAFRDTGSGPAIGKTVELTARRRSGEPFRAELSLSALNIGGNWAALGIVRDVTERRRAEDVIRAEHREMEQLLASIPSILIGIDADDRVILWNAAAEGTLGIPATAAIGHPLLEIGLQWDWSEVVQKIAASRESGDATLTHDIRFTRPDGREGWLVMRVSPLGRGDDRVSGHILAATDVTARRELESQLAQAQKLEAIGQLAAGIAHEINTPTQYVGDNLRFLKDAFEELLGAVDLRAVAGTDLDYLLKEIPRAIEQSLEGVGRVATIVRAMKDFSHPGAQELTPTDINHAIESTLTVSRNEWKYVAEAVTDLDPDLPLVPCIPGEFNQVILNLIINAAHAIADVVGDGSRGKGTITISTRRDGDWAEIRVADTGTGIPEAIRSRVFEHFFTTKEVGKGTGQGLAIARAVIVKKHGGTIRFETEVGRGTTFIIRLPLGPQAS